MKLAGMNITYRHYPFTYFLDSMQRLGLDTIELWVGEPHLYVYRDLAYNLKNIKKEVNRRGLKIVCITPEQCVYPYNIASSDSDWRKESIEYFNRNLTIANELETDKMLITSGVGDFSLDIEDSWKYALDSITEIGNTAKQEGITLVFEALTKYETNLVIDGKDIKKVIDDSGLSNIKMMIDTVAMYSAGETLEDYRYFFENDDMEHVHLIDGIDHSDEHLVLGDGNLPIHDYVKSLKENNYAGVCTLEIMGHEYYKNPEKAVQNSIQYLQQKTDFFR